MAGTFFVEMLLKKAFPYFLEYKNIDATLLYCNNYKLPCYK